MDVATRQLLPSPGALRSLEAFAVLLLQVQRIPPVATDRDGIALAAVARQAGPAIADAVASIHAVVPAGVARHLVDHSLDYVPGEWFLEANRRLISNGGAAPLEKSLAKKFNPRHVKLPELTGGCRHSSPTSS